MAFLNIGMAAGMGFQNDWDSQIKEAQQNELLDQQARTTAENKAQLLGDKFKVASVHNEYDKQQIKTFSEKRIKDIGAWIMENRDFERNPAKWAYFSAQTDELLDNSIVDRSMRYDTNKTALQKFIADNPDAVNEPEIQQQLTESANYAKTGSTDGVAGGGKEFMFRSPDVNFDPNMLIANTFTNLKAQERLARPGEAVGVGATVKEVPLANQLAMANAILSGKDGRKMMNYWKQMTPQTQKFYGDDPVKWVVQVGSAYNTRDITSGQVWSPDVYANAELTRMEIDNLKKGLTKEGKDPNSTTGTGVKMIAPPAFTTDFGALNKNGNVVPVAPKNISAMLPPVLPISNNFWIDQGTGLVPATSLNGKSGKPIPTGQVKLDPTGTFKLAEVSVIVPLSDDLVTSKLVTAGNSSSFWEGKLEPSDYTNDSTKPYYQVVTDKSGKNTGNVVITGWVKLPESSSTIRAYNDAAQGVDVTNKNETANSQGAVSQIRLSGTEQQQQAQVDAAPSGTVFILEDGSKYTKP